jgi:hypothetical protein
MADKPTSIECLNLGEWIQGILCYSEEVRIEIEAEDLAGASELLQMLAQKLTALRSVFRSWADMIDPLVETGGRISQLIYKLSGAADEKSPTQRRHMLDEADDWAGDIIDKCNDIARSFYGLCDAEGPVDPQDTHEPEMDSLF